ncbi:YidH family protein [Nocardia sp. CA-151230]|uniref:YidH family protein n=1 Tax=Nocardia sp. CA-151230 TaxID=3239982 RepID=UPI003D919E01
MDSVCDAQVESPEVPEPEERLVDYRFTLAAERTFLAWIRTSLALLAGGVAVHELVRTFATPLVRTVVATAVIGLAAVVAAGAYVRWQSVDDAIRSDRALPDSDLMVVLAAVIATICVVAGVAVAIA